VCIRLFSDRRWRGLKGGVWQEYRRDDAGFRIEMPGTQK
jgi:hypothetical protein